MSSSRIDLLTLSDHSSTIDFPHCASLPPSFNTLLDLGVREDHTLNSLQKKKNQTQDSKALHPLKGEAVQDKRLKLKQSRIQEGFEEFQIWINDLLAQGFKTLIDQPHENCENIARRLVDAQLRGLSVWIHKISFHLKQDRPLDQKIAYLTHGLSSILATIRWYQLSQSDLPFHTDFKRELDQALGFTPPKKTLITSKEGLKVRSKWQVFALICTPENGGFTIQCWLRSIPPFCRFAVIHLFSLTRPKAHQYSDFKIGSLLDLRLIFYPSLWPLRAFQIGEEIKDLNELIEDVSNGSHSPNSTPNLTDISSNKNKKCLKNEPLNTLKMSHERIFKREFKASLNFPFFSESQSHSSWSWPNSLSSLQESLNTVLTQKMYTPWRSWIPFQCKDVYLSYLPAQSSNLVLVDQGGEGAIAVDLSTLPSTWSVHLTLLCPITQCIGLWNGVEVRLCVLIFEGESLWMNHHQNFDFE